MSQKMVSIFIERVLSLKKEKLFEICGAETGANQTNLAQECLQTETSNGQAVEYRAYRLYLCRNVLGGTYAISGFDVPGQVRDISLVVDRSRVIPFS